MLTVRQTISLIGLFILAVATWIGWAIYGAKIIALLTSNDSIDKAGQWGDTFGGLNVLFTAAGTCLVLATLMLQRQALKAQAADLHRDRFESSFFKLMELMRELKKVETGGQNSELVIDYALSFLRPNVVRDFIKLDDEQLREKIVGVYLKSIHPTADYFLSPYFRVIYTILRRISEDKILSLAEKAEYGNLLRSQLVNTEVALIGYNALIPHSKDFSRLLIEFHIFKYLPGGEHRAILGRLFPPEAFASRD